VSALAGQWYFRVRVVDKYTGQPTSCQFKPPNQPQTSLGTCSYDLLIETTILDPSNITANVSHSASRNFSVTA